MTRLLATLLVLLTAATAWAQGPGPGVNPWVINGNTISYNNGGITVPSTVTGKSKGAGTINVSGGYYVNGAKINGIASATSPILYSSEVISFDFSVANTWVGKQTFAASAAPGAGVNLPEGAAPSSPVNGDLWTTTAGLFARINGATVGPFVDATSVTVTSVTAADATLTVSPTTGAVLAGLNLSNANTWVGAQTFAPTGLLVAGSSSGTGSLRFAAVAGTSVLTFPAGTTDFSATGGTSNVVRQASAGAALTVGQLACADLSNAAALCSSTDAANLSGTVAPARITGSYTGLTGTGTLTAGATGAGFTVALGTSTVTGQLAVASGGTGLGTFGGTNTLLYTTTADNLSSITTANNGTLITSAGGVPSISSTLPSAVQANITTLGTVTAGTISTGTTIQGANVTWTGLIPGTAMATAADASGAPSATFGAVKCDGTTVTCSSGVITSIGGAATDVAVGTTTVSSGTTLNLLYNNGGVLGNRTIASVLTAGNGILVTGTTNAGLAVDAASAANVWAATANKVVTADGVSAAGALTTLTSATTIAVDMATGINFTVTLGHNATLGAPSNTQVGRCGLIYVVQPAAGGPFTLAYNAAWKFSGGTVPVASTAANAVDVLTYCTRTSTNLPTYMSPDVK